MTKYLLLILCRLDPKTKTLSSSLYPIQLIVAPFSIALTQQLVTTEIFSFPCWHTSRHTNTCVQFPAMAAFPVTELSSLSPFTTIFSHIFNLLSAFTYDSTSLCTVLTSPSTTPSSHSSCTHSTNSALFHFHPCPPPYAHLPPFLHTTRNELGALGRLESACTYTRTASVACSHHRDSETWNRWAQQFIDWQPTNPLVHSQHTVLPNSKSPLGQRFFWFDVKCVFVFKSRPEDFQNIQSEKLRNTAVFTFQTGIATFLFPLIALD